MYVKKATEYQNNLCIVNMLEDMTGGGVIAASEIESATLPPGVVVGKDANNLLHICKAAKLHANATNTAVTYQVKKNHEFKVGDVITTDDVASCKAYPITVIDKSNAAYDVLTVGTSLGVAMTAANGVYIIQADAQDASGGASSLKYDPIGITFTEGDIANANANVAVLVRGTVQEALLPYYVPDVYKTALSARILFV
jgi:hypothetical protein